MLTALLEWLGVPGSIVVLVAVGWIIINSRRLLSLGNSMGSVVKILMAVVAVVGVGLSGIVPGFSVTIEWATLAQYAHQGFNTVMEVLPL